MSDTTFDPAIPDLGLPFPSAVSPFADAVEVDVRAWGLRCELTRDPAMAERCAEDAWGHLAARGWPHCDRADLALCAQWLAWTSWLDDQRAEGVYGTAEHWRPIAYRLRRIHTAERPAGGDSPMEIALADLCRRTYAYPTATPAWRRRFVAHLDDLLGTAPKPATTGGSLPLFDLTELLTGHELPPDITGSPSYRQIQHLAAEVVTWIDDLHAMSKDLAAGRTSNLVLSRHAADGLSFPDAVDAAGAGVLSGRGHESFPDAVDATLAHLSVLVADHADHCRRLDELVHRLGLPEPTRAAIRFCVEVTRTRMASLPVWCAQDTRRHRARPPVVDLCAPLPGHGAQLPPSTPHRLHSDPFLAGLRVQGAVVGARFDGRDVWLTTTHAETTRVLTEPVFSRAASLGCPTALQPPNNLAPCGFANLDGAEHLRVRRLMSRGFTPRRLSRLRPRFRELTDGLLDSLAEQGPPADFVACVAMPLSMCSIADCLGIPRQDFPEIASWLPVLMSGGEFSDEEMRTADERATAYVRAALDEKAVRPGDDVYSELVQARRAGYDITDDELTAGAPSLLLAGFPTTGAMLGTMVLLLLSHPDQLALLRERPDLTEPAVEELLRYSRFMTAGAFPRTATADVVLGGVTVRAGETVIPVPDSANRDSGAFPDPDRLDIRRTHPAPHLAFGQGPHTCLGAALARLLLRTALPSLLARFPHLELAVHEAELQWLPDPALRALMALPVTW